MAASGGQGLLQGHAQPQQAQEGEGVGTGSSSKRRPSKGAAAGHAKPSEAAAETASPRPPRASHFRRTLGEYPSQEAIESQSVSSTYRVLLVYDHRLTNLGVQL